MEIQYEQYQNENYVLKYTQTLINNNELCIICLLDETEEDKQWHRYKLVCGHIFHTRCFRKWIDKKNLINCPYCGDISPIEKNNFCNTCNIFGHETYSQKSCIKLFENKNRRKEWKCNMCNSILKNNSTSYRYKHSLTQKCFLAQQINIAIEHSD
jgi:hypothetical protein